MYLTDEDLEMFNGSIQVMRSLFKNLRTLPTPDAIMNVKDHHDWKAKAYRYARKDKKDTLVIDATAENIISTGSQSHSLFDFMIRAYGDIGVVITEECGKIPKGALIQHHKSTAISDPLDISSYYKEIGNKYQCHFVGDIFDSVRKDVGETQARRHSCNSSITLIKDNMIKYTIVLNLITGDIYIGSSLGLFRGDINKVQNIEDISTKITFYQKDLEKMMCYTKEGKYEENRNGTRLRFYPLHEFSNKGIVGPMRFTFLVDYGDEKEDDVKKWEVGLIAHNGEKIQEALPNVAMALFSGGQLQAYKLFCDPEHIRDRAGKYLTPPLANSLYYNGLITREGIKSDFLNYYEYPSEFRDTTIIIPTGNEIGLSHIKGMPRNEPVRIV